jgi:hypothetical protein
MGVNYIVLPLNKETRQWLDQESVAYPAFATDAVNPTPQEIRAALGNLDGIRADFGATVLGRSWDVVLEAIASPETGPWTMLVLDDYQGEDVRRSIAFHKGWPDLVLAAAKEISRRTGPLLVLEDSEGKPIVVDANSDTSELLRLWFDDKGE